MAITVMDFKLKERTVTQTDIAPSWMSAVAMAPAVIEARKGMNMEAPLGLGVGQRKAPRTVKSRALRGDGMGITVCQFRQGTSPVS